MPITQFSIRCTEWFILIKCNKTTFFKSTNLTFFYFILKCLQCYKQSQSIKKSIRKIWTNLFHIILWKCLHFLAIKYNKKNFFQKAPGRLFSFSSWNVRGMPYYHKQYKKSYLPETFIFNWFRPTVMIVANLKPVWYISILTITSLTIWTLLLHLMKLYMWN